MITAVEIGAMGLSVQRTRLNVIANSIANANTTRTSDGGPFRRQVVMVEGQSGNGFNFRENLGVKVREIRSDDSPLRRVYEPAHPDAVDGYVMYPNVQVPVEMVDLVTASRAYEANLAAIPTATPATDSPVRRRWPRSAPMAKAISSPMATTPPQPPK